MAEKLESFEFKRGSRRSGSRFDAWLDGGIYRLTTGEDIPSVSSGRTMLANRARKLGLKIRTSVDGDTLVVQGYSPEENGAS